MKRRKKTAGQGYIQLSAKAWERAAGAALQLVAVAQVETPETAEERRIIELVEHDVVPAMLERAAEIRTGACKMSRVRSNNFSN